MSVLTKIFTEQQRIWAWLETADGINVDLDCALGTRLVGAEGLGVPLIENVTTSNGFRGGVQFIGQRYAERYIRLRLLRKDCGCFGVCGDDISHLYDGCRCNGGTAHAMRYLAHFFSMRCDENGKPVGAKLWFQHAANDERRFACVFPSQLPGYVVDHSRPKLDCYRTEIELMSPSPYFFGEEVCADPAITVTGPASTGIATGSFDLCSDVPVQPCLRFTVNSTASAGGTGANFGIVFGDTDTSNNFQFFTGDIQGLVAGGTLGSNYTIEICPFDQCLNRFETSVRVIDNITGNEIESTSLLSILNAFNPPNALQTYLVGNGVFNYQVLAQTNVPGIRVGVEVCASPAYLTV